MTDSTASGIDLSGLDLSGRRFAQGSLTSVDLRNSKLRGCTFFDFSLRGLKLSGADFDDALFERCHITFGEGFIRARGVHFESCELWNGDGAELEDCLVKECSSDEFPWENLTLRRCAVNLCRFPLCELRKSTLESVKFNGCDLDGCTVSDSILTDCEFRDCKGDVLFVRCTLERCVLPDGAEVRDCSAEG